MNIHVDTLELANDLHKAGIERAHAEEIARVQARTVTDLIEPEFVTRDHLKSELTQVEAWLKAELKSEIAQLEARTDAKLGHLENGLREEMRNESTALRRLADAQMLQIRALQFGGASATFALGGIVMLSRLIK